MSDDFSNNREIQIIRNLGLKDRNTMDIGANTGVFTRVLAEVSKHVYVFEPEPKNFQQLKQNMQGFNNVTLFEAAASYVSDEAYLHLSMFNSGMHRLYQSKYCNATVKVKTIRIDDLGKKFTDDNISIDFIKMDVEGFEYYVTIGMSDLLERDRPIIMSEWHPDSIRESGADPEKLFDIMTSKKGFKYQYPRHCITGEIFYTYEELEKATNDPKGGVNILWL